MRGGTAWIIALFLALSSPATAQNPEAEPSRWSGALIFPVAIHPIRASGADQPGHLFDFTLSRVAARTVARDIPSTGPGETTITPDQPLWLAALTGTGKVVFCTDQNHFIRCLRDADDDGRFEQMWFALRGGCTLLREAACREPTPLAYQGRAPIAGEPVAYSTPAPSALRDPRAMSGQARVIWNRRAGVYEVMLETGAGRRKNLLPGVFAPVRPEIPAGPALLDQGGLRVLIEGVEANGDVRIGQIDLPAEFGAYFPPAR